jgi:SAM-dependent methyltransferase
LEKYDAWHHRRAEGEGGSLTLSRPWHVTVARLLPDLDGQRVLEVGCGRGDFSIWLGQRYPRARIVGVDFSAAAIDIARRRRRRGPELRRRGLRLGDLLRMPGACASPREQDARHLQGAEAGGRFVLTTENYFNGMILAWLKTWVGGATFDSGSGAQPRENFFLYWRVKALLECGGLRVEAMESNHFQWLLLPRVNPAKLVALDFRSPTLKRLFRPFGRHFTFLGVRPA